jgi:SAM-dependent methyltransferase
MLRCRDCTLTYAHPFVPGDDDFYALTYAGAYAHAAVSVAPRWEFEATVAHIEDLVGSGRLRSFRLLEIGAGNGEFVRRITPDFTAAEHVMCTEFAAEAVRTIRARGIRCEQGDVRGMGALLGGTRFDVICMFHVLEHLGDLGGLFEAISRVAWPGAHLYVAVPNDVQREYFDRHAAVEDFPPMHVTRWNRRSLAHMGARYGWALRSHQYEPLSLAGRAALLCRRRFAQTRLKRWVNAVRTGVAGELLWRCTGWCYSAAQFHAILRIAAHDIGGVSQWAHFEKSRERS